MPEFSTVHHINLSVTDLDRSAVWYTEVLGLTKGWEMGDTDGRGAKVVLTHPNSPFRLVLSHHQSNSGVAASEFQTGLDHVAFTVADRDELQTWERHLSELGIACSPIKEGATGWLLVFRDPDNIQLEVYTAAKD